jgi:hypothetical protein
VRRHQARGLNASAALALLQLMESVTEQLRTTWRLCRAHRQAHAAAANLAGSRLPPVADITEPALPSGNGLPGLIDQGPPPAQPARGTAIFSCPHCGLALSSGDDSCTVVYDVNQWARRCQHPTLQTPALCQLLRAPADRVQ